MAQTESLRDFASATNKDGTWKYPQVREDLTKIKDNHANDLFHVEHRAALAEANAESLGIEIMVSNARHSNKWYDNLELGIIAGAVLTIFAGWGLGQAAR